MREVDRALDREGRSMGTFQIDFWRGRASDRRNRPRHNEQPDRLWI